MIEWLVGAAVLAILGLNKNSNRDSSQASSNTPPKRAPSQSEKEASDTVENFAQRQKTYSEIFSNENDNLDMDLVDDPNDDEYEELPFSYDVENWEDLIIDDITRETSKSFNTKIAADLPDNFSLDKTQKAVFDLIEKTDTNLYIQGNAGTGKSTFINYLKRNLRKNVAVVAPTGVAAMNVKGETLHSFFNLPPKDFFKVAEYHPSKRLNDVLKNIEVLVIDEISMVRPDTLDTIDYLCKQAKRVRMPFGGLQVVLIGDLCQLPPVITNEAKECFETFYQLKSPFFFDSNVYKMGNFKKFEFTKVYRQEDKEYLNYLNVLRKGTSAEIRKAVGYFNSCEKPSLEIQNTTIKITPYRKRAEQINLVQLEKIQHPERVYEGIATGDFLKEKEPPSPKNLRLKIGALVLFNKNGEVGLGQGWKNGNTGIVVELRDNLILVKNLSTKVFEKVPRATWGKYKYTVDPKTKEVVETVVGQYTQFPLQLGYAITIHKAQGKTLDRVIIDLGNRGAFAHGQLYVALSRTRRKNQMYLSTATEIFKEDVIFDERVKEFLADGFEQFDQQEEQVQQEENTFDEIGDVEEIKENLQNKAETEKLNEKRKVGTSLFKEMDDALLAVREYIDNEVKEKYTLQDFLDKFNVSANEIIVRGGGYIAKMNNVLHVFADKNMEFEYSNNLLKKKMQEVICEEVRDEPEIQIEKRSESLFKSMNEALLAVQKYIDNNVKEKYTLQEFLDYFDVSFGEIVVRGGGYSSRMYNVLYAYAEKNEEYEYGSECGKGILVLKSANLRKNEEELIIQFVKEFSGLFCRADVGRILKGIAKKEKFSNNVWQSFQKYYGLLPYKTKGDIVDIINDLIDKNVFVMVLNNYAGRVAYPGINTEGKIIREKGKTGEEIPPSDEEIEVSRDIDEIIIDCVRKYPRELGRRGLSKILTGNSRPDKAEVHKKILETNYNGILRKYTPKDIERRIRGLEERKKLIRVRMWGYYQYLDVPENQKIELEDDVEDVEDVEEEVQTEEKKNSLFKDMAEALVAVQEYINNKEKEKYTLQDFLDEFNVSANEIIVRGGGYIAKMNNVLYIFADKNAGFEYEKDVLRKSISVSEVQNPNRVRIGDKVTFYYNDRPDEMRTYQIVPVLPPTSEAEEKIYSGTPLGRCLLGAMDGDIVELKVEDREERDITIVKIEK